MVGIHHTPSLLNWLLILASMLSVELAGAEIWRGYIDRPYEELNIWQPGAVFPARRTQEAPGRIGKRLTWLVLDGNTWPALAPIVNDVGFLLARVPD